MWLMPVIAVPVIVPMIIMMGMGSKLFSCWLIARPVERHINQAPRIEAGQQSCADAGPERDIAKHNALLACHERALQNSILGEEARETPNMRITKPDDRDCPDQHRCICELLIAPDTAEFAHILLMVVAMNNGACAKE